MRHSSLQVIQDEHQALAAMLRSISMMLDHARQNRKRPDFGVLRAMFFYIDEFPEQRHHRKETELLFPLIRSRSADAAEVLDKLDRDHASGEKAIRDLQHALLAYELMGESRRVAFEDTWARYQGFYMAHMHLEEDKVLPLARQVLSLTDWATLDQAFAQNRDPLTGHSPEAEYERLFSKIVNSAPAPIGLG